MVTWRRRGRRHRWLTPSSSSTSWPLMLMLVSWWRLLLKVSRVISWETVLGKSRLLRQLDVGDVIAVVDEDVRAGSGEHVLLIDRFVGHISRGHLNQSRVPFLMEDLHSLDTSEAFEHEVDGVAARQVLRNIAHQENSLPVATGVRTSAMVHVVLKLILSLIVIESRLGRRVIVLIVALIVTAALTVIIWGRRCGRHGSSLLWELHDLLLKLLHLVK